PAGAPHPSAASRARRPHPARRPPRRPPAPRARSRGSRPPSRAARQRRRSRPAQPRPPPARSDTAVARSDTPGLARPARSVSVQASVSSRNLLTLDQREEHTMTTHELAAAYADADLHALGIVDRDTVTVADLHAALDAAISQAGLATVRRDGRAVR